MKLTITRGLAAACSLAAVTALGAASPAHADAGLNGQYSVVGGSDQFYVTAVSNCATEVALPAWSAIAAGPRSPP